MSTVLVLSAIAWRNRSLVELSEALVHAMQTSYEELKSAMYGHRTTCAVSIGVKRDLYIAYRRLHGRQIHMCTWQKNSCASAKLRYTCMIPF